MIQSNRKRTSVSTSRAARRATAGIAAVALASTSFALASPAFATADVTKDRIAGDDRYETSAAVSAETFTSATNVVIASGLSEVDGLSAAALAGQLEAPVLLVNPTEDINAAIVAEIERLGATSATIVGGTAAVSAAVESELEDDLDLTVTRLGGDDRYETSNLVADTITNPGADTAFLVTGRVAADALAASAPAYSNQHPIILTEPGELSADAASALEDNDITNVIIVGGTDAVSEDVADSVRELGIAVERFGGTNRYETAADLADELTSNTAFGYSNEGIVVTTGLVFADALSAGPFAGENKYPILFAEGARTEEYVRDNNATINLITAIGGTAAVSEARLDALVEAATTTGSSNITLNSTSVEQGGTLSGTVTGTNIESVTVSGCGFTDSPVANGAFSLVIPSSQPVGDCTLTFTVTDEDGNETTQAVPITVQQATVVQGTGTVRPELASATIVQTLENGGTTVRYTFDEALTGSSVGAGDAALFAVYTFDSTGAPGTSGTPAVIDDPNTPVDESAPAVPGTGGDRLSATSVRVDEADTRSVLATFSTITTADDAAELSVAVVDENAVNDSEGDFNPIGDAALNPGTTTNTPLAAGLTVAPDLVTVGNFRADAGDPNSTLVDFTFDEDADAVTNGYSLVSVDGLTDRTGTLVAGDGTTVHTVRFSNAVPSSTTASTITLTAASQARGVVSAGTVNETSAGNEANVRQAADVSAAGNSETPDLVSAAIIRDADIGGGMRRDQVLYTFDEPVLAVAAGDFVAYTDTAEETLGTNATRSTANDTQVLVTFGADEDALDRAVGASVGDGAVTEAGGTNRPNQQDEAGISNVGTGPTTTTTSGRTAAPDLIAVSVERTTDQFGTTSGGQVRYTFDEDVAAPVAAEFSVVEADGTIRTGTAATVGTTEDTDSQVIVTFAGATTEAILRSVLGTVDDGAVADQATGTGPGETVAAAPGDDRNPEGAQLATGSTGTPGS